MSSSSGGGDASLLTAMPFFQEKSAFDQCLPNLTFQQVVILIKTIRLEYSYHFVLFPYQIPYRD